MKITVKQLKSLINEEARKFRSSKKRISEIKYPAANILSRRISSLVDCETLVDEIMAWVETQPDLYSALSEPLQSLSDAIEDNDPDVDGMFPPENKAAAEKAEKQARQQARADAEDREWNGRRNK